MKCYIYFIIFTVVTPYIHDTTDRNSVSLVCRQWFNLNRLTRKHVTIHFRYALHQRFPHFESLTVKGKRQAPLFDSVPIDYQLRRF